MPPVDMMTMGCPMTVRGGGDPRQAWLARRLREWARRLGALPPMRMTASWSGSASDPPNTSAWRDVPRPIASSPRIRLMSDNRGRKTRLAIHLRAACSRLKALRNTRFAKAASRQAARAFRSLDPFRAPREPDRRRRDEERPFSSKQRTVSKPRTERPTTHGADAAPALTAQPFGQQR